MSKQLQNPAVTSNSTILLGTVDKKRDFNIWKCLFFAYGTWGGGTVAWLWSPDGGTTKLPITDYSGNGITSTANDSFSADFPSGSHNKDKINLYATLSGATSPSLLIGFYDNN